MPYLAFTNGSTLKAHTPAADQPAILGTRLQQAYDAAVLRAAKVASREDVISMFTLGDLIASFEDEARTAAEHGDLAESITLGRVVVALKKLIPVR